MTGNFHEIHAIVDRLLLEQGEYSPLELLLAEARLSYTDYEGWRCGLISTLDEVLAGSPERIRSMLEVAARYASSLGLQSDRREYIAWKDRTVLRLSADAAFEGLCCRHYRRAGNEMQLDLFMDNSANVLVNGIIDALCSRRGADAQALLEQLQPLNHPRFAVLEALCKAAQKLNDPVRDYLAESEYLEAYVAPLATAELGIAARDFLSPLWHRLADALRGAAFSAESPLLHASYPLAAAYDWAGVKASILQVPEWQEFSVLQSRLAEAEYYLGEREQALLLWCRMCWDFPLSAEQSLLKAPDKNLRAAWERYRTLEIEPELDIRYFPAWLLLERKPTKNIKPGNLPDDRPGRAYGALQELLAEGRGLTENTMALRLKLKQAHAGLFGIYMHSMR